MDRGSVLIERGITYVFPESACMLATDKLGALILIEQFRKPSAKYTLELPGGVVQPEELPFATATREFEEETGLEASECRFVFTLDLDLSTTLHRTHIFTATAGGRRSDLCAEFTVRRLQLADALTMVRNGSITHAPTVAATLAKALDIMSEIAGV